MLLLVLTQPASGCVLESAQNFLSFFVLIRLFLEDAGCMSGYDCGRVGVLLPSISILRQLATLSPFGEKKSQYKNGSQNFKDTLLCLRSAKRGCSSLFFLSCTSQDSSVLRRQSSDFAQLWARHYDPLQSDSQVSQVMERVLASCPPSLYSTVSPGPRQDSTADTHKPITLSYLILTPSKLLSMSNQPFRRRPLK